MPRQFVNNWGTTLAADAGVNDTSLVLADASGLPALSVTNYVVLTLVSTGGVPNGDESAWEIVVATGKSGNTLAVLRGQENTEPVAWPAETVVELRVTAAPLSQYESRTQPASSTAQGAVRLATVAEAQAGTATNIAVTPAGASASYLARSSALSAIAVYSTDAAAQAASQSSATVLCLSTQS